MHISIRFKLLIYMTVTILLFTVLLFGSNTILGKKYYIYNKKHTLMKSSRELELLIENKQKQSDFQNEEVIRAIKKLEKETGTTIVVGNESGQIFYPGEAEPGMPFFGGRPFEDNKQIRLYLDDWKQYEENGDSFFLITKDPALEIDTLRFQTRQDNGIITLLWVPMAGISESVSLSNNFAAAVGLLTICITGLWTLVISDKFTKPIKEINKITKQMAKLDFTESLSIKSKDELGELSDSINHLSNSLDCAVKELYKKNKELEKDINYERQLDKMRKEFVSNVSHELKTPIFLLQGYAEGLKTNIADGEEKKNFYCDVIMEETEKMSLLVKDLLDLSRMESGIFSIQCITFNISDLLKTILHKYDQIIRENGILFTADIPGGIMANADILRTEQIIENFLNNAITYTDSKKIIAVSLENQSDRIRLSVYNSGKAIPEEELDRIWNSFYRTDKARSREQGGSGLGLSIVRAIQELHGSGYGVVNKPEGVEFWCDFHYI